MVCLKSSLRTLNEDKLGDKLGVKLGVKVETWVMFGLLLVTQTKSNSYE